MRKEVLRVRGKDGLHARPAAELVQLCKGFISDIKLEKGGRLAAGKSIIGIMTLGISRDEEVTVTADGDDETAAIDAIKEFLNRE